MRKKVELRRRVSWSVQTAVGGAAAIALTLFLSSLAAGVTLVPPYKGTVTSLSNTVEATGCGAVGKNIVKSNWSSATGVGHFADSGAAKSCAKSLTGVGATSTGLGYSGFQIAIPVHVGKTGTHHVGVTWSFAWAGSIALAIRGTCTPVKLSSTGNGYQYCMARADAVIYNYVTLADATNGSFFFPAKFWSGLFHESYASNSTACSNFMCTYSNTSTGSSGPFSGNTSFTWWFNTTLNKSHSYTLLFDVYGTAWAQMYGNPSGGYANTTGSAKLDMATTGKGATLTGISVT